LIFFINVIVPLQANQEGSSSVMEFMGHQKAFDFLFTTGITIKSFVSDRHTSIAKWMLEECPKKCKELGQHIVNHFFDLWHIGKSKDSYGILYFIVIIFHNLTLLILFFKKSRKF
jgi:hypothetical protein